MGAYGTSQAGGGGLGSLVGTPHLHLLVPWFMKAIHVHVGYMVVG